MSEHARKLKAEEDWGELILEIQTYPGSGLSENHGTLYNFLYGPMEVAAKKWLKKRNLTEARDGALTAIGIDKVFKEIEKFEFWDDNPAGIGNAFKAWALKCCDREWGKQKDQLREVELDSDKFNTAHFGSFPSPEEILIAEVPSTKPISRTVTERALMKDILEEELNKLLPAMKEALLETEELKSVERPHSRGKQGEAASVAVKHCLSPGAIRTSRTRLLKKVKARFEQECKS